MLDIDPHKRQYDTFNGNLHINIYFFSTIHFPYKIQNHDSFLLLALTFPDFSVIFFQPCFLDFLAAFLAAFLSLLC